MRIWVGGVYHETHTFVRSRTALADFAPDTSEGPEFLKRYRGTRTSMGGAICALEGPGVSLVPGVYASARPSGLVDAEAWAEIRAMIMKSLSGASPVDGVLLILHGAMVAAGEEDPEGELLEAVRELTGRRVPVVATLDLHANVSDAMGAAADALVGYDTYPHVDPYERALDAAQLLVRVVRRQVRPISALVRPALLPVPQAMYTAKEPMRGLIARAQELERTLPAVLNVSVYGGFPFADVPFAGMCVSVTTDGDAALARTLAEELGARAEAAGPQWAYRAMPVTEAVERAAVHARSALAGTAILVDGADNIGGGTPGDGTVLLAEILRHDMPGALVTICDAEAVALARAAGVGMTLSTKVGGKSEPGMGPQVAVTGRVAVLHDGEYVHEGPYMPGQHGHMGPTAVLDVNSGALTLVLTSRPTPPWDAQYLKVLGLNPANARVITVKAALAWRSAFEAHAGPVLEADTPGPTASDLTTFAFQRVRRPIYPLDEQQ